MMRRYLGLATDVGSTMIYKTLNRNVEFICRTTIFQGLLTELTSPDHK